MSHTEDTAWRLVDFRVIKDDDNGTHSPMLLLQAGGKAYGVTVTALAPLATVDVIQALRAAQAHLMGMLGVALPEGARPALPGEMDPPPSGKPS